MARDEDAAWRWAPPGHPSVPAPDDGAPSEGASAGEGAGATPEQESHSAAAPWTRGLRPPARPGTASADPTEVRPPEVPWVAPPEPETAVEREKSMLPIALGVAALAVLACVPHWVAPTIALMVAVVGVPIAWGFRRISHGRRRVQYIVVVLTLLLVVALSIAAPLTWLQLGVLQPLTVPDVPAPTP